MRDQSTTICRRNCWVAGALAAGLLWLALVLMAGYPAGQGLVIAIIVFLLLSFFLIWAFCSGAETRIEPVADTRPVAAPASAPQVVADPAPSAPLMAAPVVTAPVLPAPVATMPLEAAPARPVASVASDTGAKPRKSAKPAAAKPVAKAKPAAAEKSARTAKPRAAGLDAAMGRTKEASQSGTPLLSRPRGGKGDDLKLIIGVGPVLEKLMNGIGVWHFDQVAAWKAADIALVDSKMGSFRGRITRDGWVKQARLLAKGEMPVAGQDK